MKRVISMVPVFFNIVISTFWVFVAEFYWFELLELLDSIHWYAFTYQDGCIVSDCRVGVISMIFMLILFIGTTLWIVKSSKIVSTDTRRRNYLVACTIIVVIVDVFWTVHLYNEYMYGWTDFVTTHII